MQCKTVLYIKSGYVRCMLEDSPEHHPHEFIIKDEDLKYFEALRARVAELEADNLNLHNKLRYVTAELNFLDKSAPVERLARLATAAIMKKDD